MAIETVNPATGETIHVFEEMSDHQVDDIINESHTAYLKWRDKDFNTRTLCMMKIAALLRQRKNEYAILMATEMGKPLTQGESEIEKCALVCEHYAEHAATYLQSRIINTEMSKSYITYQPLGVVFAIMPWNFPFWQVFRFAAPTLMAGNTALLKHAPISTGTALAIEKLFIDAGFPDNIFRSLIIAENNASKVINHPKVIAVTLTGSARAGKSVGAEAAKALKKSVLELGGSDPYLILEDADLEIAAEACVSSRMNNAGQVCIAAKRIIALQAIIQPLQTLITEKLKRYKMGNPLDSATTLGPLARKDIRDHVHEQVTKSVEKGASLITGGSIPSGNGFFYPATMLTNITPDMPAFEEEIFGPVISLISAKNEDEAIAMANDSLYGLGAAIFTRDIKKGEKIAVEKIEAGTCVINTFVASDPRLPFGGIKGSGYGRELSAEGIRSFMNIKTISIK
jgi:succinate-semialdehyde dehydrogenase/glutarate-semialdehyde dehydrogenase